MTSITEIAFLVSWAGSLLLIISITIDLWKHNTLTKNAIEILKWSPPVALVTLITLTIIYLTQGHI